MRLITPEPRPRRRTTQASALRSPRAKRSGKQDNGLVGTVLTVEDDGTAPPAGPARPRATAARARDGRHVNRLIVVEKNAGGRRELHDAVLNLTTYDFGFKDPSRQARLLPGVIEGNPPASWPVEAVAAHANGAEVARFLRRVLKRHNIDNRGGEMIASVNCWDHTDGVRPAREWKNAFWDDTQMVYGQVKFPDGSFTRSPTCSTLSGTREVP